MALNGRFWGRWGWWGWCWGHQNWNCFNWNGKRVNLSAVLCVCVFFYLHSISLCNKTQIAMDTEADRAKGCMCEGATTSKVFINFGCLIHFACQVLAIVVVSLFKDICHLLCGRQHQQKCHKKSPTRTQAMNEHRNTSERDRVRERERDWKREMNWMCEPAQKR